MARLSLQDIYKRYDDGTQAVSNINLRVEDGEFLVLVGPSGCGKSTLLRLIAGLESTTSGQITIGNTIVNDVAPKDRDIAMVFQNYALYPNMSVYDNMAFGLKMRKHDKGEISQRVESAAAILGLIEHLNKKPRSLSGGQLQRVALGRAIVRQPQLFLFDEPLSNLDAKLRLAMRTELKKLHKNLKATMVYVTHDQTEAMSMGNRLVVLKDGIMQQEGGPLEIYNNPANIFVAGFLGSPAMNFIHCQLKVENDELFLEKEGIFAIRLSAKQKMAIQEKETISTSIVAGIRPEHLSEESSTDFVNHRRLRLQIEFIEPMGNETLATCKSNDCEITARLSASTRLQPDQFCNLNFDINQMKLFDPVSGATLNC